MSTENSNVFLAQGMPCTYKQEHICCTLENTLFTGAGLLFVDWSSGICMPTRFEKVRITTAACGLRYSLRKLYQHH